MAPSSFIAEHVWRLALHIGGAHVDFARIAEAGRDGGGSHAVLAGAGLGDDPGLAHALGEQDLADAIVDLVRTGVVEFVALEIDLGAAQVLGQPLGEIHRRRPSGVMGVEMLELGAEGRIGLRPGPFLFQLEDQRHQRFGNETAAENAEHALFIGTGAEGIRMGCLVHFTYS